MNAHEIADALGGRRVKADSYKALCPAHNDNSPSLSITQADDRVLFYCWSGCSQSEVIGALKSRGLWADSRQGVNPGAVKRSLRKEDIDYMASFILIYASEADRGIPPNPQETAQCRQFLQRLRSEGLI